MASFWCTMCASEGQCHAHQSCASASTNRQLGSSHAVRGCHMMYRLLVPKVLHAWVMPHWMVRVTRFADMMHMYTTAALRCAPAHLLDNK